ncbi:MAG: cystathionine gamma-synthase [Phycisphaerae bacterium]|nr:cystathionine gamma-synthase [Phycisphaerae bacterium]
MSHDHADKFAFATRCIHAGQRPDPATKAITTPVYMTSTYVQDAPGEYVERYDYSRAANPTRSALEANLASLEGGRHGLAFASGVASIDAVIHLCKAGDRVLLSDDVYGGTFRLFKRVYEPMGIHITRVDMTDHDATRQALTDDVRLVWLETPTNPTLKIIDIAAIAEMVKKTEAVLAVDNTFATPALQLPLSLGADIISHSTTKYLGGHADLVGGALITDDDELLERLRFIQLSVGAVCGPMDAFLVLRSTKTLHLRMQRHCENAMRIAEHLDAHKKIEKVIYPGLKSHPQHEIAKKQMSGFGGIITCYVKGTIDDARRFVSDTKLFSLAESLGGVESLIEHPGIMTHASIPDAERAALGINDQLVRLSVGIEDVADQIADLDQALA